MYLYLLVKQKIDLLRYKHNQIQKQKFVINTTDYELNIFEVLSIFFSSSKNALLTVKTNSSLNCGLHQLYVPSTLVLLYASQLRLLFSYTGYTCLELFSINQKQQKVFYNFVNLLLSYKIILITTPNSLKVVSLSTIFKNLVWLERELMDFSNLYITGLTDTRRLLVDYLQGRSYPTCTVNYSTTYNFRLQDLYTI